MATFLLKTEPGAYSYADLERAKQTVWEGVTSNAALKHMRSVRKGDEAFIYHSGDDKAIVGLATIASAPRPDPKADNEKIVVFDIKAKKRTKTPVSLAQIKADPRFAAFDLVRQSRLSVMPVPDALDEILRGMAGL